MKLGVRQGPFRDARRLLQARPIDAVRKRLRPRIGGVDFGDLRRLEPISANWGFDRGLPVDRYFIEDFLRRNELDIGGRVLEVADRLYTRKFGADRVERSDVVDVRATNRRATIIADLADAPSIPSASFDCVIVTQTLHLIFEIERATETVHRILAPGGVVLATVPGITATDRLVTWNWAVFPAAAERLFAERFGAEQTEVEVFGNLLTTTAFLFGLAAEELTQAELARQDDRYPLLTCIRCVKTRR